MQEEKYYTCRYDRPFKEIMLNENNKDILKSLLEFILKVKINNIEINHTERNTGNLKVKRKTYDVLLKTDQGKIEIELNNTLKEYVRPRNMAYISDIYAHHTLMGETYNEDTLIVQINLTYGINKGDFKGIGKREYYIQDENRNKYVKNFKIYEYNMDYYNEIWYNKKEEEIEENKIIVMLDLEKESLKELSKKDKVVNKYMEELNKLNSSPDFREYMSHEEDERKIKNSLKEEGISQAKKEIAIQMLNDNMDINIISKYTGLSIEKINELK